LPVTITKLPEQGPVLPVQEEIQGLEPIPILKEEAMAEEIMMMTGEGAGEEEDKQVLKISCVFQLRGKTCSFFY